MMIPLLYIFQSHWIRELFFLLFQLLLIQQVLTRIMNIERDSLSEIR